MANNIIQTPEAQKKIKDAMQEFSYSKTRAGAERDLQKEIVASICDEYQIDKKIFRKSCTAFHNDSFNKNVSEQREFEVFFETITGQTPDDDQQEMDQQDDPVARFGSDELSNAYSEYREYQGDTE